MEIINEIRLFAEQEAILNYYLAVDLGASSGRHILGHLENGRMITEEIHRFENYIYSKEGDDGAHLCWNHEHLFKEIITGMKKCGDAGKIPQSVAIDTWGVDFVLLNKDGELVGDTVSYRDSRTAGVAEEVYKSVSAEELYAATGMQYAVFNTIYQLAAIKKRNPRQLDSAEALLFTPDYFNYLLTGRKVCEYTVASTSNLINARTGNWDYEIIDRLGFPRRIFGEISEPGECIGKLSDAIAGEVGYNCNVILAASHDTASAVLAVPMQNAENSIYLSSGTWSLMGIETKEPILTEESRQKNFTNEGGYGRTYRYLSNIMGLWMLQSVRRETDKDMTFATLCRLAEEQDSYEGRVDVNDERFLAPENMSETVCRVLQENGYRKPINTGELAACIYHSLADKYAEAVKGFEQIAGKKFECIHIVGGGCNAEYLNRLTAEATGKTVYSGPSEGTAIGNILVQLLRSAELKNVAEARKVVYDSYEIKRF